MQKHSLIYDTGRENESLYICATGSHIVNNVSVIRLPMG